MGNSPLKRVKRTTEQFIQEARAIHGDKFNYDQSVFTGIDNKLIVTCKIHGSFHITPYHHLHRKQGCRACSFGNRKGNPRNNPRIPREISNMKDSKEKWDLLFDYNPETGELINKFTESKGSINGKGYRVIGLGGLSKRVRPVHIIIW
jgi:hypothetical protein